MMWSEAVSIADMGRAHTAGDRRSLQREPWRCGQVEPAAIESCKSRHGAANLRPGSGSRNAWAGARAGEKKESLAARDERGTSPSQTRSKELIPAFSIFYRICPDEPLFVKMKQPASKEAHASYGASQNA